MIYKELSVLLVEDNPGDAYLVEDLLGDVSDIYFHIRVSNTLEKALQEIKSSKFDVILLDLGLPDAKGVQALERMIEAIPDMPVVVITGLNDQKIGQLSVQMGAQGYMIKGELTAAGIIQTILFSIERAEILKRIKSREKELQQKNKQLSEALGTKNMLFSIISHDLKGPVNSIVSLLDIIHADFDEISDENKKKYIESIYKSAFNTQQLIVNLLEWAHTQTNRKVIDPQHYRLSPLIRNSIKDVEPTSGSKNIEIKNNIPEEVSFYADKDMISAVIRNILSNAIKFTTHEGVISVNLIKKEPEIMFSIRDNGVGIEKEVLESLFTLKKAASKPGTDNELGSGFGLMLCKEFLERNDGRIWIESLPGKGTEVFIALPASDRRTADHE